MEYMDDEERELFQTASLEGVKAGGANIPTSARHGTLRLTGRKEQQRRRDTTQSSPSGTATITSTSLLLMACIPTLKFGST